MIIASPNVGLMEEGFLFPQMAHHKVFIYRLYLVLINVILMKQPLCCYTRVPVLYEKYEDQVNSFSEKAMTEIKKQYAVFDAKVLSKIPRGPLKDKKKGLGKPR
ncbi:hypothetical protein ACSBR1_037564 [Camellia fascicularis]